MFVNPEFKDLLLMSLKKKKMSVISFTNILFLMLLGKMSIIYFKNILFSCQFCSFQVVCEMIVNSSR